jgi:hypothetical protein
MVSKARYLVMDSRLIENRLIYLLMSEPLQESASRHLQSDLPRVLDVVVQARGIQLVHRTGTAMQDVLTTSVPVVGNSLLLLMIEETILTILNVTAEVQVRDKWHVARRGGRYITYVDWVDVTFTSRAEAQVRV